MPEVTVYTGNFCGFCTQVKALLERRGIPYTELSVEDEPGLREKLLARSGRRTLPQVFVGERYIGGADELRALDASGELTQLMQNRGMTMAEQNTVPPGAGDTPTNGQGPAVALQTVYIKDLSFEAPKGPFLPAQTQDPKISLNLSTLSSNVGQDAHEVILSVTIEAKAGDIAVYLAEVKQAGVFLVRGFGADETRRILGSFAPNILFPYIRQTVSDVVVKGGFPPFLLPHVNFDALFERSLQEQAARQPGQPPAEQTN